MSTEMSLEAMQKDAVSGNLGNAGSKFMRYKSHTIQLTHLTHLVMYNSNGFSIFTDFYTYHYNQFLKHFQYLQRYPEHISCPYLHFNSYFVLPKNFIRVTGTVIIKIHLI